MENTIIRNECKHPENILDCLSRRLYSSGYLIFANILDFRDYGVPHHRERLITIGCRIPSIAERFKSTGSVFSKNLSPFHAPVSHGKISYQAWKTIRDTIGHLPELDDAQNGLIQMIFIIAYQNGMIISIFGCDIHLRGKLHLKI